MRIAFITPEFVTEDNFCGGLANYLHRITQSLASVGHDIHVVTQSTNNQGSFIKDNINIHRLKTKPVSIFYKLSVVD